MRNYLTGEINQYSFHLFISFLRKLITHLWTKNLLLYPIEAAERNLTTINKL